MYLCQDPITFIRFWRRAFHMAALFMVGLTLGTVADIAISICLGSAFEYAMGRDLRGAEELAVRIFTVLALLLSFSWLGSRSSRPLLRSISWGIIAALVILFIRTVVFDRAMLMHG